MEKAKELIKTWEGLRLSAYKCQAGVWTIGYGRTGGVKRGDKCTEEQAEKWLSETINEIMQEVEKLVKYPLTECQRGALISFCFNVGVSGFKTSTLLRIINEDPTDLRIVKQFSRWCKITKGGEKVTSKGLLRRRLAEVVAYFENYPNRTSLKRSIQDAFCDL